MSTVHARNIDRLIQSLYSAAIGDDRLFRSLALDRLCAFAGAGGAAWLTVSGSGQSGEYSTWPAEQGPGRDALQSLQGVEGDREILLDALPASFLDGPVTLNPPERALILRYAHRGADLVSRVLLRFAPGTAIEVEPLRRAVGHMIEAGTLSLRLLIERDEWLQSLGRTSRGAAALVDASGTLYAASELFRRILGTALQDPQFTALPCPPPDGARSEPTRFSWRELQFRATAHGDLFLINVREPLPMDSLSPREQEIARALGSGRSFKSVSRQLGIAVSTVANHATNIYRKLGIYRREDLVLLLRRPGQGTTAG